MSKEGLIGLKVSESRGLSGLKCVKVFKSLRGLEGPKMVLRSRKGLKESKVSKSLKPQGV